MASGDISHTGFELTNNRGALCFSFEMMVACHLSKTTYAKSEASEGTVECSDLDSAQCIHFARNADPNL
jgi:hypothetical protein